MPTTPTTHPHARPRVGLLFDHDWDARAHRALSPQFRFDRAGFDLFSFPSNARLIGFDLERFAARQARAAKRHGWSGVLSHHEQFGALGAALVAEAAGLPGPSPQAIVACQHKLHARRILQEVCPQANVVFCGLDAAYGEPVPKGLDYPAFVKPVKAAFSVLAREVADEAELAAHLRFGWRELWVIRRLVEPFERVARTRLPTAGTAHRLMLEEPVHAPQYNLDGYVRNGRVHALGVVDAVMYPGTQAFMRFELSTRLDRAVQTRALDVAQRFLSAVGFDQGMFNMEFLYDAAADRLAVIEFNPRLASQFGDLYQRVLGLDPHWMALALAIGEDPATVPRSVPTAGAAASFVYRSFAGDDLPPMPTRAQRDEFARAFPDALLLTFPKSGHSLERDFKWLQSHRYGIVHLGGRDRADLHRRILAASDCLGWPAPAVDMTPASAAMRAARTPVAIAEAVSASSRVDA